MTHDQLAPSIFDSPLKDALKALQDVKERRIDDPNEPPRLPLEAVTLMPTVFQVRGMDIDEHHLSSLVAVLKGGTELDPITVWRCGRHVLLVDGHHRLEAYTFYQQVQGRSLAIPVRWFHGSANEAMKEAAAANVKVKLQMTPPQRANLAWRLTLSASFSRTDTASIAGVSTGLVATMRKAKKALGEEAEGYETWWQAQRGVKGIESEFSHEDIEAMMELQAQAWAERIGKACGTKLSNNPAIAARAFTIYFGRKAAEVIKLWIEEVGEDNVFDDKFDEPPF